MKCSTSHIDQYAKFTNTLLKLKLVSLPKDRAPLRPDQLFNDACRWNVRRVSILPLMGVRFGLELCHFGTKLDKYGAFEDPFSFLFGSVSYL